MANGFYLVPKPVNEPVYNYAPNSRERAELKAELKRQSEIVVDIPIVIGGKEYRTENVRYVRMPHDHQHVIAKFYIAGKKELELAARTSMAAKAKWADIEWEHRASIFLKAAELLSGPYRAKVNAATMLGQSKTAFQAEIDAVCELADFFRYNCYFAQEIYKDQPQNTKGVWNRQQHRPLDGFVVAISPFNFTSIGGNLCTAPAIMGNTIVWKPASTAVLSNYYVFKILEEAGIPTGVINFVPCSGSDLSQYLLTSRDMAGVHFTGSTEVFNAIWKLTGDHITPYKSYPRLVGETGGKDFIFAHKSAQVDALVCAMVRGSFEYQGQKCSAASRAYVPKSIWPRVEKLLLSEIAKIKVGDVCDFRNFMGAVIDEASFKNTVKYIEHAKKSKDAEVLCGGYDGSKGWFVQPTVILAKTPTYKSMVEEIFAPVLTIFVYDDKDFEKTIGICDTSTKYALTGAVFAQDREAINLMEGKLVHAAGNFYINDKPTGAVVGQQPFGGARASGTNDKAGSMLNLYRWSSPRTIKETFVPPTDFSYPFMQEE
jgi:1-pyrroline-5-carboxylate dehydrogenase